LDLAVAIPAAVVLALPLCIVWLVRQRSGRPVLTHSERVGRNGGLFDQLGLDLSNTGAGGFRGMLIGLPALFNVVHGEMSLVGPLAPHRREVARYDEWHHQRLRTTPGLTGLWRVHGREDLTFDEMVRLDLFYAEHWSLWLDLKILIRSAPAIWRRFDAAR
jgi:lipopolysaccharide/colanic/teichoic acid biosynthesis glycosyltransferase